MCGIAGLILKSPGDSRRTWCSMLDGCQHRGPDSTGFAIYRDGYGATLVCRIYLGCPGDSPDALRSGRRCWRSSPSMAARCWNSASSVNICASILDYRAR